MGGGSLGLGELRGDEGSSLTWPGATAAAFPSLADTSEYFLPEGLYFVATQPSLAAGPRMCLSNQ